MKDRIFSFIDSKHLTPTEFADTIGVSRAAISSIKTGRTQPTLMLVEKIKEQFPEINVNWLIFGEGEMIYSAPKQQTPSNNENIQEPDLFSTNTTDVEVRSEADNNSIHSEEKPDPVITVNEDVEDHPKSVTDVHTSSSKGKVVDRIILLYNDGTFEEFNK